MDKEVLSPEDRYLTFWSDTESQLQVYALFLTQSMLYASVLQIKVCKYFIFVLENEKGLYREDK